MDYSFLAALWSIRDPGRKCVCVGGGAATFKLQHIKLGDNRSIVSGQMESTHICPSEAVNHFPTDAESPVPSFRGGGDRGRRISDLF